MANTEQGYQRVWKDNELKSIRLRFMEGETQSSIAKSYETTQKTISEIVKLKTYVNKGLPSGYEYWLEHNLKK